MIAIALITTGTLLHYSNSKYFPESFKNGKINPWIGLLFILAGVLLFITDWGWASGLLCALSTYMLAIAALQIALVSIDRLSNKS